MTTHVIFDLDGTLIDSSISVLSAFSNVLSIHGIQPAVQLEPSIIGPPLRDTLSRLTGSGNSVLLDALSVTFKAYYDTAGYKSTTVFPGVSELLSELGQRDIPLYLATNKRLHPTRLILDHLGWARWFRGVYALDCVAPSLSNKGAMLAYLLRNGDIDPGQAVYVGDKLEDGVAADQNNLPFLAACWGYGALDASESRPGWRILRKPIDLMALFSASIV